MGVCEIFNVVHKRSFRWKWRHLGADGCVNECAEEYALYFECVAARPGERLRAAARVDRAVTLFVPDAT